jgi:4-amino-4-deoxy-L-arabinose transferase-like glycosyltransferase
MEGHAVDTANPDAQAGAGDRWRDLGLVTLLLLLALGIRDWVLTHTEVPARDTIGFIRYALEFDNEPWWTVLQKNHQHPGYPVTILAVSVPVRALSQEPAAEIMSLSARLASGIAAVLLVIPMFFLGKMLFHRAAGFGAAALFQCLPVSAHILSDGLSEALFLLLACTSLALAVLAIRTWRPMHFGLCGACAGFAYLTRPEGVLLVAATGLVLFGLCLTQRRSLRQLLACGGSLLVPALLVGSLYVAATGHFTGKPSVGQMLGDKIPELEEGPMRIGLAADVPPPLLASTFAFVLDLKNAVWQRAALALWNLCGELVKCFHYVAWLPTLLGMWWFRRRPLIVPGLWVLLVLCALWTAGLCWLAVVVGYLSDRHLLLLVLCGSFATAAAVWELPSRLTAWYRRQAWPGTAGGPFEHTGRTAAVAAILLGGMLAVGLPKALERLHANRAGYHAAGLWLAEHTLPVDEILDDHCWAHFYAGRVFLENKALVTPAGYQPARYVVVGRRDKEIILAWNRDKPFDENQLRALGGHIVYSWPLTAGQDDAAVVVYAIGPR